jgi:hypothetical protein
MVTTVAPTIPVLAANNVPTITTEMPRPPFTLWNKDDIDSKRFSAILDFSNITPIKINIGIAISVSFVIMPNILLGKANNMDKSKLLVKLHKIAKIIDAPDKVKATGYPSINKKITIIKRSIESILKPPYWNSL